MPLEAHLPENRQRFLNERSAHWAEHVRRAAAALDLLKQAEQECMSLPQKGEREELLHKFWDLRVHLEYQIMYGGRQVEYLKTAK